MHATDAEADIRNKTFIATQSQLQDEISPLFLKF